MPIIAKGGDSKTYAPAPEGVHQAVCVDVIDLGMVKSAFNDDKTGEPKFQHKVNVVWQIGELRDDGKRFQLYKRYTLSLHEKAALRHDLESWRGKAFSFDELAGFDVEKLIAANCLVNVQHRKSADGTKTYANVVRVMPLIKGMPKLAAVDYKRPEAAAPDTPSEPPPSDDDAATVPDYDEDDQVPF
jgi:hypothetical protein